MANKQSTKTRNARKTKESLHIRDMYGNWFLDYASYVILERAVPAINDGLKPVQRRILHAMKQMDDGRFHKVANIIGNTMQYHPHGDAAIGDALVNLGQKGLLIETQGNWGDIRTGDRAAAPRYIEARLSKFALEVAFNAQTTQWQASYDGRKVEPVYLPVKFPLLLAQGAEGIAVGLSTKIMPHNVVELLNASICILKKRSFEILPDFPTGGMADFRNYNEGQKGGKVRIRAKIDNIDKKKLIIRDIPFGTTTSTVIDSIVKASEQNKIKIKRVIDNTAKNVEIIIELPPGVSPDLTIDALYAFTDCEVSISPNTCLIIDEKPQFLSVHEVLKYSTRNTLQLLKQELEIKQRELAEKWHFSSLEKIFIEKRIYRNIEECETWEAVVATIDRGLKPYKKRFKRKITEEDIVRLTEIKIKRISKYDSFRADEAIKAIETEAAEVAYNLKHLKKYAVAYFESLIKKYGEQHPRRTEVRSFDNVQVSQVAVANQKLYVNRSEGFIGYGLKKEEYLCDCSDLDDVIVFLKNGTFLVARVSEKAFVGKDILYASVWKKNDARMTYNMVYFDGASGKSFVKRFTVSAITRDKVYLVATEAKGSQILYLTANPNSESEIITIHLRPKCRAKKKVFNFDFADLAIKGRGAKGNILTRYPILKITQKTVGASTLGGLDIWYDETVGRLNTDNRGRLLGNFESGDLIMVVYKEGILELTSFELTNRYDDDKISLLEKFSEDKVVTVIHFDGHRKQYFVKRFQIERQAAGKTLKFINDTAGSFLALVTTTDEPVVEITYTKGKAKKNSTSQVHLSDLIGLKGWKAKGNRLSPHKVLDIRLLENQSTGPDASGEAQKGIKKITSKNLQEQPQLFDD